MTVTALQPNVNHQISDGQWASLCAALGEKHEMSVCNNIIKQWRRTHSENNHLVSLHAVVTALLLRAENDKSPTVRDEVWRLITSCVVEHMHFPNKSMDWVKRITDVSDPQGKSISWSTLTARVLAPTAHVGLARALGEALADAVEKNDPNQYDELAHVITQGWMALVDRRLFGRDTVGPWMTATISLCTHLLLSGDPNNMTLGGSTLATVCRIVTAGTTTTAFTGMPLPRQWLFQATEILSKLLDSPAAHAHPDLSHAIIKEVCVTHDDPLQGVSPGFATLLADRLNPSVPPRSGDDMVPGIIQHWLTTTPHVSEVLRILQSSHPKQADHKHASSRLMLWRHLDEPTHMHELTKAMGDRSWVVVAELVELLPAERVAAAYEAYQKNALDQMPSVRAACEKAALAEHVANDLPSRSQRM